MSLLETRLVLVLSTAHLTEVTCAKLIATPLADWPVAGGPIPYGFYIYAHDGDPGEEIEVFAPELLACLTFARSKGFDYVMFDCDAEVLDQLPAYQQSRPPVGASE